MVVNSRSLLSGIDVYQELRDTLLQGLVVLCVLNFFYTCMSSGELETLLFVLFTICNLNRCTNFPN